MVLKQSSAKLFPGKTRKQSVVSDYGNITLPMLVLHTSTVNDTHSCSYFLLCIYCGVFLENLFLKHWQAELLLLFLSLLPFNICTSLHSFLCLCCAHPLLDTNDHSHSEQALISLKKCLWLPLCLVEMAKDSQTDVIGGRFLLNC